MCRHRAPPQQLLQFRDVVLGLFHVFWEYVVLKNVVLLVNPLNRYFLSTCCLPGTTIEAEDTALDLERQSVLRCYNRRGRFPGPAKCGRMPVFSGKTIPLLFFILMKNKHTHTHTGCQEQRSEGGVFYLYSLLKCSTKQYPDSFCPLLSSFSKKNLKDLTDLKQNINAKLNKL